MASSSRSGSSPGADVGRPKRSSKPLEPSHEVRRRSSPAARPAGLGDHAHGHGLAVLKEPPVAGDRLDGVADGVAEVQDGAKPGLLALVLARRRRP